MKITDRFSSPIPTRGGEDVSTQWVWGCSIHIDNWAS